MNVNDMKKTLYLYKEYEYRRNKLEFIKENAEKNIEYICIDGSYFELNDMNIDNEMIIKHIIEKMEDYINKTEQMFKEKGLTL